MIRQLLILLLATVTMAGIFDSSINN